jgi:protein-arginine kinase activator protein McsA
MNYYECGNGERVTQTQINHRLSRAKKGFIERYVCESCETRSNAFAAWSHTISQKRCKELHKTDLIWLEGNGSWDCHPCHTDFESFKSGKFSYMNNAYDRMLFIGIYDKQTFVKRYLCITNEDLKERLKTIFDDIINGNDEHSN